LEAEDDHPPSLLGVVEDSGIGIAENDISNLFQDFYRTDEAKASQEIGTGLGLSIVKQIVDSYGGEVGVTSRLGQGSRFTFILPLEPLFDTPDQERILPEALNSRAAGRQTHPMPRTRAFILGSDSSPSEG
jgi:K+-sensing histidine kinase KdpD